MPPRIRVGMPNPVWIEGCQLAESCKNPFTRESLELIGRTVVDYQAELNRRFSMIPRLFNVGHISFVMPETGDKHNNYEMVSHSAQNPLGRTGRTIIIPPGVMDPALVDVELDGWVPHELGHIFMNEPRLIDPALPQQQAQKGLSYTDFVNAYFADRNTEYNLPLLRSFFEPNGLRHPFLKGLSLDISDFFDAPAEGLAGMRDFIKDYDALASIEEAQDLSTRLRAASRDSTGSASGIAHNAIEMIADRIAFLTTKEPISWRYTVNRRAGKYMSMQEAKEAQFSIPFVGIFSATVEKVDVGLGRGPRRDFIEYFSSGWTASQRDACYRLKEIFSVFWDGIELKV